MTESEAKKFMLIEKECINRDCDRDCANCDIVQKVEDLNNAYDMAVNALEKQIPKKPVMKPYFEDMEEEYLCCPTCGEILTDRIPFENEDFYFHCLDCGQAFDWSDTD